MAGLDPRFGPPAQNRTVTVEYLDELYDKADELRLLKQYLEATQIDIGGFDEWRSQRSTSSSSHPTSERDSTRSDDEIGAVSTSRCEQASLSRRHAAIF